MPKGLNNILWMILIFAVMTSCKKEKRYSTIPQESMLMLNIKQHSGDNLDPFTNTKFDFVGFPGAIGYSDDLPSLPFLMIGKNLHKKNKLMSHFIGTVRLQLDGKTRYLGIAMPVNDKHKTVEIESYNDFSTEYANVKLWLTDWLTYAYRDRGLTNLTWNNEIDILRKFVKKND